MKATKAPTINIQYGFKRITPANVLEQDSQAFYPSGLGDKWVTACMKLQLDDSVPEETAFLFEVARGSLVYAQFFLPLASLATEQSFRIVEAGVRRRCLDLGLLAAKYTRPKNPKHASFAQIITELKKAGVIQAADADHWDNMLFLRNRFSHHTGQTIWDPKSALDTMEYAAELLNRLFK